MTQRYFSESPLTNDRATLTGPEAHHLIHVMRAQPGNRVVLFDGSGVEAEAEVQGLDRREVGLRITARREVDREAAVEVTLGVALPKGDRQRWLVEKAVELGVRRLVPLVSARGVAQPSPKAVDRLRRTVIEASKQCGRNRLMEITAAQPLADYAAAADAGARRWIAHPGGRSGGNETPVGPQSGRESRPVYLIVGPEGGLCDAEVACAVAAGWTTIDLGARILRVETAAIALATLALRS